MRNRLHLGWWLTVVLLAGSGPAVRADLIHQRLKGKDIAPEWLGAPTKEKPAAKVEESTAKVEKAIERFNRREFGPALTLLEEAVRQQPKLPPARLMLARLYLLSQQMTEGHRALEQAAAENPDFPGIYTSFGDVALAEGRPTDALLHFEKAIQLAESERWRDPQRRYFLINARAGSAAVAESRKKWPAAQAALTAWLKLEPDNGKARQRLARSLFFQDKVEEALAELQKAVQDDKSLEPPATSMGWLYTQKEDWTKAAEWMERAVKEAPDNARAQQGFAAWLLDRDRADEAQPHARKAVQLDPDSRDIRLLNAMICRHLRAYDEAEKYLQPLYQDSPADFVVCNELALALIGQTEPAKRTRALQLAELNLRGYPRAPEALSTLGWVQYRLGNLEAAENALQAAAKAGTINPDTGYYLARVFAERGQPEQARKVLQLAVEVRGKFQYRKEARELLARLSKRE